MLERYKREIQNDGARLQAQVEKAWADNTALRGCKCAAGPWRRYLDSPPPVDTLVLVKPLCAVNPFLAQFEPERSAWITPVPQGKRIKTLENDYWAAIELPEVVLSSA